MPTDLELANRLRCIVEPPNPKQGERPWSVSVLDNEQLCEIYSLHMQGKGNKFIVSYIQDRFGRLRDKKGWIVEKTLSKLWERAIGPQDRIIRQAQIADTKNDGLPEIVRQKLKKLDKKIIETYDPLRARLDSLAEIRHSMAAIKTQVLHGVDKEKELQEFHKLELQALREIEDLLERMKLLGPRADGVKPSFNTLIQAVIQNNGADAAPRNVDKFDQLLGNLQDNLALIASGENTTKRQDNNGHLENQHGGGAPIDVEALPVRENPTEPD